jgi:REG-2-like HAD superfamily hydrolase
MVSTMIKAVFFDFFNTLAYYQPPREQAYIDICKEHGIKLEEKSLAKSLPIADQFWRDENRHNPIDNKTPEEKFNFWTDYVIRAVEGAGAVISRDVARKILSTMQQTKYEFRAYADVIGTLKILKEHKLILGLISNVAKDIQKTFNDLGLQPYLDYYVTSLEVGYDKPQPEIVQAALQKARVKSDEALYIGDQYELDIVGARGVGIKAVLIDRNNWFPEITDCPRIQTLNKITTYV